ncbi:MAG: LuxR C-terminal-related transcriptional regulator [Treponema sp.]|jgi:LuxR family maltose regulon positive regulatory protein|nr:LuxR C-terminal-related transcriptional regulator [Treponema sp.]
MKNERIFYTEDISIISNDELYLERRDLNDHLARIIKSPIITVVAGAGYGKTYSIYSFLRTYETVTLWLQVSERDNLPQRFWENYAGAMGLYNRQIGQLLAGMGFPETTRQFDRFITVLQHEMIPGRHYVQVYDDFHLISQPKILRFLDRYFAASVANITIILISRKEPAINSMSFLSKGLLNQITADELRFTEREIEAYFALQNISLSPEDLRQVHHDSEGWALAVSLAAREMKTRGPEKSGYSRKLLEMDVFRSMEEDILASMSPDLRKFLIKLSLIEHWPVELLENLLPDKSVDKTIIEEMETFVSFIRYDAYLHGYRIHHLFLDFLKEKQGELTGEEIRDVYLKDAEWCIRNNLRMDAALDYERAGDYRGLIDLIKSFPRVMPDGVAAFFMEITDRLLDQAPAGTDAGDEDFAFLRYALRPRLLLGQGRLEEATEENRRSIALFETEPPSPLSSRILASCYSSLGTLKMLAVRYTGDANVAPFFEQANKYYSLYPEPWSGLVSQCCIGSYVNQAGYPAEAGVLEKVIREFIPALIPAAFFNGYLYGSDALGWVEYYYFCADMDNAESFVRQALFKSREKNQAEIENRALYYLLRISLNAGNFAGVEEALRQLEAQLNNPDFFNRYILYDIVTGWFYAQIGQTGKIASWLNNEFEESELNTMFHGFETLVKAKCSFAEKRYDATLNILNLPGGVFGLGVFILGRLEMRVLQAVTFYNMGEKKKAFEALEDAWDMAAPNHLDMPFIELGEDMRVLAGTWLAEKTGPIPRPWLETIRSKASVYAKKLSLVVEQYLARQAPEVTLSFREMEVLEGLSRGLTREEIAYDAAMSLNTVKNVISGIYAKLGAMNRADAIRIATGAGLLKT